MIMAFKLATNSLVMDSNVLSTFYMKASTGVPHGGEVTPHKKIKMKTFYRH